MSKVKLNLALKLNKKTVAQLTDAQLETIQGGAIGDSGGSNSCNSCINCNCTCKCKTH